MLVFQSMNLKILQLDSYLIQTDKAYFFHLEMLIYRLTICNRKIFSLSRAIRRIGEYFNRKLDHLPENQLIDYFHELLERSSWSAVKLDLYGLKFFYT